MQKRGVVSSNSSSLDESDNEGFNPDNVRQVFNEGNEEGRAKFASDL